MRNASPLIIDLGSYVKLGRKPLPNYVNHVHQYVHLDCLTLVYQQYMLIFEIITTAIISDKKVVLWLLYA